MGGARPMRRTGGSGASRSVRAARRSRVSLPVPRSPTVRVTWAMMPGAASGQDDSPARPGRSICGDVGPCASRLSHRRRRTRAPADILRLGVGLLALVGVLVVGLLAGDSVTSFVADLLGGLRRAAIVARGGAGRPRPASPCCSRWPSRSSSPSGTGRSPLSSSRSRRGGRRRAHRRPGRVGRRRSERSSLVSTTRSAPPAGPAPPRRRGLAALTAVVASVAPWVQRRVRWLAWTCVVAGAITLFVTSPIGFGTVLSAPHRLGRGHRREWCPGRPRTGRPARPSPPASPPWGSRWPASSRPASTRGGRRPSSGRPPTATGSSSRPSGRTSAAPTCCSAPTAGCSPTTSPTRRRSRRCAGRSSTRPSSPWRPATSGSAPLGWWRSPAPSRRASCSPTRRSRAGRSTASSPRR